MENTARGGSEVVFSTEYRVQNNAACRRLIFHTTGQLAALFAWNAQGVTEVCCVAPSASIHHGFVCRYCLAQYSNNCREFVGLASRLRDHFCTSHIHSTTSPKKSNSQMVTYLLTGKVASSRIQPLLPPDWDEGESEVDFLWENTPRRATQPWRDGVSCYSHLPNG